MKDVSDGNWGLMGFVDGGFFWSVWGTSLRLIGSAVVELSFAAGFSVCSAVFFLERRGWSGVSPGAFLLPGRVEAALAALGFEDVGFSGGLRNGK